MTLVDSRSLIQLRRILCATDFSSISEAALLYAVAIARRYDSQIYVAHLIRPDSHQLVPRESFGAALAQAHRYAEQKMGELLVTGQFRAIPHQVLLGEGELWGVLSNSLLKKRLCLSF